MRRSISTECAIADLAHDEPNAMCIGPFGSDLLASDLVDKGVPVVFVRNVRAGRFDPDGTRFVTPAKAMELRAHRVRPGDIVITKMGLPPCIAAEYPVDSPDGIVTADIIKMTPDRSRVHPRYLVYLLNSAHVRSQVARFTFGVTRPKVTLKEFRALRVSLPSLSEQLRITDILDKADATRRKRKEAITLTDILLRATFLKMFGDPATNPKGWEVRRLEDLVEFIDYGVTASAIAVPVGPKFLRITDIQDNHADWESVPYCECDEATAARAMLRPGDIVFARTGATTGKSFWISECPDKAVFASYLIRVRPGPRLLPVFLAEFFQSEAYWSQIQSMAEGAAQPGVNASKLGGLLVPVPPMARQGELALISETILGMKRRIEAAITEADTLFDSLVHRAFNGEISP